MGACYFVKMKVNLKDEKGAVSAINHYIASDARTHYSLEKYAELGCSVTSFEGLMKILLAEMQNPVEISHDGDFTVYENGFNASYGWKRVMIEWFDTIAPFLVNGSELLIYPDEDYDKLIVQDGKCVQVH